MKKNKGFALEVIEHQNGFIQLESLINYLTLQVKKHANKGEFIKDPVTKDICLKIEKAIFNRFGIKTFFNIDVHPIIGAVMILPISTNHVLIPKIFHGDYLIDEHERIVNTFKDKKGYINTKDATVSGIFSSYEHKLFFSSWENVNKFDLTVKEQVAIILHEIGHVFTYYMLSDRLNKVNQVLLELNKDLNDYKEEKIIYHYKELDELTDSKFNFEELISSSDRKIIGMKLFKKLNLTVNSLMNNDKYGESSSEQLADMFASRFGYFRDLVSGLDKLNIQYTVDRNDSLYRLFMGFEVFAVIWRTLGFVTLIMLGHPVVAILHGLVSILFLNLQGAEYKDYTYDDVKMRYTRIKHQLISRFKDNMLTVKEEQQLLEQLAYLDKVIEETNDNDFILKPISDFIFSKNKSAKEDILLQQTLEKLAHSDLFSLSVKFKHI